MVTRPGGHEGRREHTMANYWEGYGTSQIRRTMTVGELVDVLSQYDEDTPVYLSFDNGYTYGGITEERFEEDYGEDNEDE